MPVNFRGNIVQAAKFQGTKVHDETKPPLWVGPNAFINVATNVPLALNSVTISLSRPISSLKTGLKFVSSRGSDGGVRAVYLPNKDYMKCSTDYTQVTNDKKVIDTDYPLEITISANDLISKKSVQYLPYKASSAKDIYQVFVDYVNDTTVKFRTIAKDATADKTMLHTKYTNSVDAYNTYPIIDKIMEV